MSGIYFYGMRKTPDAYYYLGRFIADSERIRNRHFNCREELDERLKHLFVEYYGSLEEDGMLQEDMSDILEDLRTYYPRLTRKNLLVFCYTAARVPLNLICQWADISSEGAVSSMKTYMKGLLNCSACPRKEEYLGMLSR